MDSNSNITPRNYYINAQILNSVRFFISILTKENICCKTTIYLGLLRWNKELLNSPTAFAYDPAWYPTRYPAWMSDRPLQLQSVSKEC